MPSTQPRTAAKADLGADLSSNTAPDSSHDNTVEMKTHKRSPKRSTKADKPGEKVAEKNGDRPKRATVRRVPRQERSKILVDCIRIAACDILQKRGPKALTTNNIAARAGVSIGSLYQYFPNKLALVEAVRRRHFDEVLAVLVKHVQREPASAPAPSGECISRSRRFAMRLASRRNIATKASQWCASRTGWARCRCV